MQWRNQFSPEPFNLKKIAFLLPKSQKRIIDEHDKILDKKLLDEFNDHFVKRKLIEYQSYFNEVERFPFDNNQREAILRDEVNTLVIAGAGTGKTATLVGKVAYLIQN